ncbi:hypothetical protein GCM10017750_68570 [Streptomyces racemochromogenes]
MQDVVANTVTARNDRPACVTPDRHIDFAAEHDHGPEASTQAFPELGNALLGWGCSVLADRCGALFRL